MTIFAPFLDMQHVLQKQYKFKYCLASQQLSMNMHKYILFQQLRGKNLGVRWLVGDQRTRKQKETNIKQNSPQLY